MPSKNTVKTYVENGFYHVYNRGVEKRNIFLDDHDYRTFLFYLKLYLSPLNSEENIRIRKTFHQEIMLHSFCLMPNHFHLLLQQKEQTAMTEFVRALSTSYSMYFNKKYKRVGSLFQGRYKAAIVENDEYLLQLARYIHRNPIAPTGSDPARLRVYPYSSYGYYLGKKNLLWVKKDFILSYFNNTLPNFSYASFVEERNASLPTELTLEDQPHRK